MGDAPGAEPGSASDGEEEHVVWWRYVDDDSGTAYYFNAETSETTWDLPAGVKCAQTPNKSPLRPASHRPGRICTRSWPKGPHPVFIDMRRSFCAPDLLQYLPPTPSLTLPAVQVPRRRAGATRVRVRWITAAVALSVSFTNRRADPSSRFAHGTLALDALTIRPRVRQARAALSAALRLAPWQSPESMRTPARRTRNRQQRYSLRSLAWPARGAPGPPRSAGAARRRRRRMTTSR